MLIYVEDIEIGTMMCCCVGTMILCLVDVNSCRVVRKIHESMLENMKT